MFKGLRLWHKGQALTKLEELGLLYLAGRERFCMFKKTSNMGNTINSTEYKILKFLSDSYKDVNITDEILIRGSGITPSDFNTDGMKIKEHGYIAKTSPNSNLEITSDGRIRLSKMQTDVEVEELQKSVARNTKATNLLAWVTASAALIGTIAMFLQVYFASQQNHILRKQLKLEHREQIMRSSPLCQPEVHEKSDVTIQIK